MEFEEIYNRIKKTFISVKNDDFTQHADNEIDLDIQSLDSIQFVQLIIAIESEFQIQIPDEYLLQSGYDSLENMADIIITLEGGQ